MIKKILLVFLILVAIILFVQQKSDAPTVIEQSAPLAPTDPSPPAQFNADLFSRTEPSSPWVVVNKKMPLAPADYAPTDLVMPDVTLRQDGIQVRQLILDPLKQLFDAAASNGTPLKLSSGYRSYNYQVGLYNGYVSRQGQQSADEQSARPGYSEHQTGLAIDVGPERGGCQIEACFAETPAGKWVAANAHRYGFIIRYDQGQTATTGYIFEPWHLRYVGLDLATEMQQQNVKTLEDFFGLPPAPNY
jgi:zinc D-Ala-D-Ala carboxypeptidase